MSTGPTMDRELSVGEIFSKAFTVYSGHFLNLYLPFLIVAIIDSILSLSIYSILSIPPIPTTITPEDLGWLFGYLLSLLGIVLLIALISWVLQTIAVGVATKYTADLTERSSPDNRRAFGFVATRLGSLLVVSLITGVLIGIGLILFVVPGIIIAIMFSVVIPCIIIGGRGAFNSLGESIRLASNRWGKVFAVLLINFLITLVASFIGGFVGGFFGPASGPVSSIVSALASPIEAVAIVMLYYSLAFKEAGRTRYAPQPPPPPAVAA